MSPSDLKKRLENAFLGAQIEVTDLTGTQDHYQVSVVSPVFSGKSRIQQQRLVMDVFQAELRSGEVHALTIRTATPA